MNESHAAAYRTAVLLLSIINTGTPARGIKMIRLSNGSLDIGVAPYPNVAKT